MKRPLLQQSAASTGAGEYVSGKDGGRSALLSIGDLHPRIDMLQGQKLELAQMLALTPMPPVLEPLLFSLWAGMLLVHQDGGLDGLALLVLPPPTYL